MSYIRWCRLFRLNYRSNPRDPVVTALVRERWRASCLDLVELTPQVICGSDQGPGDGPVAYGSMEGDLETKNK